MNPAASSASPVTASMAPGGHWAIASARSTTSSAAVAGASTPADRGGGDLAEAVPRQCHGPHTRLGECTRGRIRDREQGGLGEPRAVQLGRGEPWFVHGLADPCGVLRREGAEYAVQRLGEAREVLRERHGHAGPLRALPRQQEDHRPVPAARRPAAYAAGAAAQRRRGLLPARRDDGQPLGQDGPSHPQGEGHVPDVVLTARQPCREPFGRAVERGGADRRQREEHGRTMRLPPLPPGGRAAGPRRSRGRWCRRSRRS